MSLDAFDLPYFLLTFKYASRLNKILLFNKNNIESTVLLSLLSYLRQIVISWAIVVIRCVEDKLMF